MLIPLPRANPQANDFERYKELMAQEQDAAANEKIEVIERFLRDTEEYLTRLTEKIASVQLNQEASTAAAAATADARAQARLTGLGAIAQTEAVTAHSSATIRVAAGPILLHVAVRAVTMPSPPSPPNGPPSKHSRPSSWPWISCKRAYTLQLVKSSTAHFDERATMFSIIAPSAHAGQVGGGGAGDREGGGGGGGGDRREVRRGQGRHGRRRPGPVLQVRGASLRLQPRQLMF